MRYQLPNHINFIKIPRVDFFVSFLNVKLVKNLSYRDSAYKQQFYECVNCDLTAQSEAVTSNCKQNKCLGHFCVYATQRMFGVTGTNGGSQTLIHEKQGCINVSDNTQVCVNSFFEKFFSYKWDALING